MSLTDRMVKCMCGESVRLQMDTESAMAFMESCGFELVMPACQACKPTNPDGTPRTK